MRLFQALTSEAIKVGSSAACEAMIFGKGGSVRQHSFWKSAKKSIAIGAWLVALVLGGPPRSFALPPGKRPAPRVPADVARFQRRVECSLAMSMLGPDYRFRTTIEPPFGPRSSGRPRGYL